MLNVEILKRIRKHILEKPRRFVMRTFVDRAEYHVNNVDDHPGKFQTDDGKLAKFESCGTAACIAGWAVLLEDGIDCQVGRQRAIDVLGLEPGDDGMRDDVFECDQWPSEFSVPYREAKTQRGRVNVAAKFIDFLIKHGPSPIEGE